MPPVRGRDVVGAALGVGAAEADAVTDTTGAVAGVGVGVAAMAAVVLGPGDATLRWLERPSMNRPVPRSTITTAPIPAYSATRLLAAGAGTASSLPDCGAERVTPERSP